MIEFVKFIYEPKYGWDNSHQPILIKYKGYDVYVSYSPTSDLQLFIDYTSDILTDYHFIKLAVWMTMKDWTTSPEYIKALLCGQEMALVMRKKVAEEGK